MADHLALNVPELTADVSTRVLWPSSYTSWTDCLAANSSIQRFKLMPGNYRSWGRFTPTAAQSGTSLARRVLMHNDETFQPWRWAKSGNEALLEVFELGPGAPVNYWTLAGLTTRGHDDENSIRYGSHDNIIHKCLIEEIPRAYGIRILLWAHSNTVQYCVIRNWAGLVGDSVGVQIKIPTATQVVGGIDETMINNRVVYCEMKDYVDHFAISHDPDQPDYTDGICDGTIVAYNHFYDTLGFASTLGENTMDLKSGSSTLSNPVWVYKNLFQGTRRGTLGASDGAGVVCHNWSRNTLFEENVYDDMPLGTRMDVWPGAAPQVTRNIVHRNNLFHNIRKKGHPLDRGTTIHARLPELFENNVFSNSDILKDIIQAAGQAELTFNNNYSISVNLGLAQTAWNAGFGNQIVNPTLCGSRFVIAYPLTNPTIVEFPNTDPTNPPSNIAKYRRCGTGGPVGRVIGGRYLRVG